ncbi:type IV pilus modification protein PilV [Natronospirillum operosum]|uniref:Type IV pilus modification protein PilV n=1 Tax=Natronospirillum operosum TaxID=2759953 RepID=A0A4Z0W6X6_9GAMM|nr:type IV pilus modification protein PilV [Natronospirillum operosum]TGG91085.1 type IV pilus modification protein PilV [Natronospirillum operosum]
MLSAAERQRGVSLIEVLVAVVILAVGLLGLAALLGNAMQSNQHAQGRTQAVFLASDMMERLRANRNNIEDYAPLPFMDNPADCNTSWAPDNSTSVAANDIGEWQNSLRCLLPDGNGRVTLNDDLVTITVRWVEVDELSDDGGAGQPTETVTLVSEL